MMNLIRYIGVCCLLVAIASVTLASTTESITRMNHTNQPTNSIQRWPSLHHDGIDSCWFGAMKLLSMMVMSTCSKRADGHHNDRVFGAM
jgi:hypothetical protein